MSRRIARREFFVQSVVAGTGAWCASQALLAHAKAPSDKLHIALIGVGGRGASNLAGVSGENIVALCDVDEERAAGAFEKYPKAKRYADFRKLLDEEKGIDAVVVSTPDHCHAVAAALALDRGLHVYCEKPLTHSVYEARVLREKAAAAKTATQMGNQGHSLAGSRQSIEIIRSGALGDVTEVHSWTDRPIWPQGIDRPADAPAPPATLDWNLWLGPAPERPYHPAYAPFNWRGWWDFGTGALGDMACHVVDMAYWALDLGLPTAVEAQASDKHAETAPAWSIIQYDFPATAARGPVKLTWYDGGKKPPSELVDGRQLADNGTIIVGAKGTMWVEDPYGAQIKLLPEKDFAEYRPPSPSLPRAGGHHEEWILACKGGPASLSNFGYAGPLTEALLLGNVALRVGQRIEYDATTGRVTNCPDAAPLIRRDYRSGYVL